MSHWPRIFAALLALAASGADAQTLLEAAATLGKKPAPVELEFQVPAPGNYRITLTDLGTSAGPLRMSRVDAGIVRGAELVLSVNVTAASSTGTASATFAATAGTHRLVLIGQPAAGAIVGSAGVRVDDPAAGTALLETLQTFTVPPPPVTSPQAFEVADVAVPTGNYTLTTADLALPQAMQVLHTTVIKGNGAVVAFESPAGTPIAFSAAPGDTFDLFVYAELRNGAPRGLAGLAILDTATGSTALSRVFELGEWRYRYTFDVAAAATLTASLADLQFPSPLAALAGQVVRDGQAVGTSIVPAAGATFGASPGTYTLYVDAAQSATPGSFGAAVRTAGGAVVYEEVENVVPTVATDVGAVEAAFDVAAAGNYTLTLTDFGVSGFFDAFTSLQLALTRDNQLVDSLMGPGTRTFAATPGRYGIAIVADPAGVSGEGLLGVRVRGGPADTVVFDRTEAVGADFISATVDVGTAQSVDVRVSDLVFPADFDSLRVAVTRGAERIAEITGTGTFTFQATPGQYIVNLLGTADAVVGYSTFGIRATVTPAAPVVSLAASAGSVTVGNSVTLTWAAQNADTCTASGGWSGSRATSGSVSSGALQVNTTFTLSCTGPGGTRDATAAVAVAAAQRSGGGGSADAWLLLLLGGAALWPRRRRGAPAPYGAH